MSSWLLNPTRFYLSIRFKMFEETTNLYEKNQYVLELSPFLQSFCHRYRTYKVASLKQEKTGITSKPHVIVSNLNGCTRDCYQAVDLNRITLIRINY